VVLLNFCQHGASCKAEMPDLRHCIARRHRT
jgi:hypothetical protein